MANKELTARIKLDTHDAESKLKRLDTLIKSINKAVTGNANTNKLESALTKQVIQAEKAKQATLKTEMAQERLSQEVAKTFIAEEQVNQALANTAIKQEQVKQAVSKTAQETGKELVAKERVNQALAKTAIEQERVKQSVSKTAQELNKTATCEEKVKQATIATQNAKQKLIAQHARTHALIEKIKAAKEQVKQKTVGISEKVKAWAKHQQTVFSMANATNGVFGAIGSKLKMLASTYLGIMGMKAAITTSDTLTSTQNKLNNLNGGNKDLTQEQMDKMYVSANKVRMAYTDMAANASKSMTLAGDAFQGNIDNAIRFQEIMAETYALGGASAEEMSTSMYQMIQALGSGTLAGDELRSVREGAPLAYKAIEQFAQGVYNTDESLKQLAADGKITSDMVVAAVMDAGTQIDEQFEKTAMTFGQAWDRIKSAAVKAFEPIGNMLNDMLNKAAKSGLFEKIEQVFWNLAKAVQIAFKIIENAIIWIADNWNWLKWVIIGALTLIMAYYLAKMAVATYCAIQECIAWAMVNTQLLITIGIITVVIAAVIALLITFLLWKTGAIDTCQAIVIAILIIGVAITIVMSIITGGLVLIPVLIAAGIAVIINWLDYFLGVLYSIISVIWNLIVTLVTAIIQNAILPLTTAWDNFANFFGNLFNDPIAAIIRSFEKLADSVLSILESIAKGIDAVFGSNLAGAVQGWRSGLSSKADDLVKKYGNGTYEEKSDITGKVQEILDSVQGALLWNTSDAWNTGMSHGSAAKDWLNEFGSQFQLDGFGSGLDSLGEKLGLNFEEMIDSSDRKYDVGGAYNAPSNDDLLNGIKGDTGSIAKSMDLSKEDLDYLRKVAEMEWKKEFTTASIKIDMTNNNTVNGESDLDGIVTKLADKLYEEMNVMANGVYA